MEFLNDWQADDVLLGKPVRSPTPGPGARVYGYLRASPGPFQERSTTDQKHELEAYAQARGWLIVAYYEDDDRSGSSIERRPEFLRMLADCRQTPRRSRRLWRAYGRICNRRMWPCSGGC